MAWKDNFVGVFKDYCNNTTLHGYKYLVLPNRKIYERFIWISVLISAIASTAILCNILVMDYYKTPTVTTLESIKHPIQEVPFPGVAICNINKISRKHAMELTMELAQRTNVSIEVIFDAVRYFGRLYDFEVEDYDKINTLNWILEQSNILNDSPEKLLDILEKLSPQCDETVIKCIWQGQVVDCSKILLFRRTMDGFCCTFNYNKKLISIENISSNKKSENVSNEYSQLFVANAGIHLGLSLVVSSDIDDYYYPLISGEGLSVKIFNSFDYPDASSGGLVESFLPLGYEVFAQISPTTVQAVPDLRQTTIESRDCIFDDERTTAFDNQYYSSSDCLAECKMKSILAICECIPFFMPVLRSYKFSRQICTLSDLNCLNKYKEKWVNIYPDSNREELNFEKENSVHCPNCLPSCEYVTYSVATNFAYLLETSRQNDILKGLNLSEHSLVHVYFATTYTTLYKTDLYFYWFDIISNFGGLCSLFMGFSIISTLEFLYFFTIRYIRAFGENHRKEFVN